MNKTWGAPILNFDDFNSLRPSLGKVVLTSGGFDPIHPGHISCIAESKQYGDTLVVIVNGDTFLTNKKGKPFQNLKTRCEIVSGITNVDFVIPFEIEKDQTVSVALEAIKPDVFTKGGDRTNVSNIPEWKTCERLGIKIITGVGEDKKWSSSQFLKDWSDHKAKS